MKRRSKFTTAELRDSARIQAKRYAKTLKPLYVGISDGQRLMLQYKGKRCTHQLVEGAILPSTPSAPCPLDLGADYFTYLTFPRLQRSQYSISERSIILRDPPFDVKAFLADKATDVAFVAGDAGAGKTTYAWQLAKSPDWDPLWLDASLLRSDPIETLREAKDRLTGFTGDIAAFLRTLRAYRDRPRQKPTGIIVDAADEWDRVHKTLPILLRFAKGLKFKVVVFGRPQAIDFLVDDAQALQGFSYTRYDLATFNDGEWARAAAQYIADYNLQSRFEGRAKVMSQVPEMMALIASAYQDETVDPELTERSLYEAYRRRKAARLAPKTNRTMQGIQFEIFSVATAMLEADRVALDYGRATHATSVLDDLVKEDVLRSDGRRYVRFRFGRVRDDLLRDLPAPDLFAKPIVGRSALAYAAIEDVSVRREYIRLSLQESDLEAVCIVREQDWWSDLAEMPPTAIRNPYIILGYARDKLREYPRLLSLGGADPNGLRLASVHRVEVTPIPLWRTWLAEASSDQQLHDVTDLTLTLLRAGKLPVEDANEAVEIIWVRVFADRRSAKEGYGFWQLVREVCKGLSVRKSRNLLRRVIPTYAIAHSSVNHMHHFYPGIDYSQEMMAVVEDLRSRSSPRSFEAWASALLLNAHVTEWPSFTGKEPSGSNRDNAWLIDAIVPALSGLFAAHPAMAVRLLSGYRISRLHPAFRLRAYIYAAPIESLERLRPKMLAWRRMRSTGIPPLQDALDSRASESPSIAEHGLNEALKTYNQPINEPQTRAFHRRLAKGDPQAMRQAIAFVSRPDFKMRDMFRTNFFAHLDWAEKRPIAAAKLMVAALRKGYEVFDLVGGRGYNDVLSLAYTNPRVRKILHQIPNISDALAESLHSAPEDARASLAVPLYDASREHGKRSLIRWAHKFPRDAAVEVMRRGLRDDAVLPEECSSDDDLGDEPQTNSFHDDVWFSLVMCWQEWKTEFFHKTGIDLLSRAKRFTSPVGIAATIMPLQRYAQEYHQDEATVRAVMRHLFTAGNLGGPKLRDYVAKALGTFYGSMNADERDEFFSTFADTETAAVGSLGLAMQKPADVDAFARALQQARTNPHRSMIAWNIFQSAGRENHELSDTEVKVVDALLENPNQETLHNLSYAARELSESDPAAATRLLLRVARRAAETGAILHSGHTMQYDWLKVSVADLEAAVASIVESQTTSWAIVETVVAGLSAKTAAPDVDRISVAFEALVAQYEYVREPYSRWRSGISRD